MEIKKVGTQYNTRKYLKMLKINHSHYDDDIKIYMYSCKHIITFS